MATAAFDGATRVYPGAKRVAVLRDGDGVLQQCGTPQALYARPGDVVAYPRLRDGAQHLSFTVSGRRMPD